MRDLTSTCPVASIPIDEISASWQRAPVVEFEGVTSSNFDINSSDGYFSDGDSVATED